MELARIACIAPPLTDEILATYRTIIDSVPERTPLRDALEALYKCATAWWGVPVSKMREKRLATGTDLTQGPDVRFQKLDTETMEALYDHIPWMEEILGYEALFEQVSDATDKELRDCAFHLVWHAKELTLDREPITLDRIVE